MRVNERQVVAPRIELTGTSVRSYSTTITGDAQCRATDVDYRLDTDAARAFLGQFVSLP